MTNKCSKKKQKKNINDNKAKEENIYIKIEKKRRRNDGYILLTSTETKLADVSQRERESQKIARNYVCFPPVPHK